MAGRKTTARRSSSFRVNRSRHGRRKKNRGAAYFILFLVTILLLIVLLLVRKSWKARLEKDDPHTTASTAVSSQVSEPAPTPTPTPKPTPTASKPDCLTPTMENGNDLLELIWDLDDKGAPKTCYLTFDDGPTAVTPQILDVLKEKGVQATFFTLGVQVDAYPETVRRAHEEGHLIANHSYSHRYDDLYASSESFWNEVQSAENAISSAIGEEVSFRLFRFPGGSFNMGDHAEEKQVYKEVLRDHSYFYVDWNAVNGDAEANLEKPQDALDYMLQYLNTSSSAVLLMHDAPDKQLTAEALPMIIDYLRGEGYLFRRLDEMPLPPEQSASAKE